MSHIVIFSSTSGIAQALAEEYAKQNQRLILCARNEEALRRQAKDLAIRYGHQVPYLVWDLRQSKECKEKTDFLFQQYSIIGLIYCAGILHPQEQCETESEKCLETFDINLSLTALVLNQFAAHFSIRGSGFISCISSVAGDRGRAANYVYGASKAGLNTYLEGMRCKLKKSGVFVQIIKPGPVRTRMTLGMKRSLLMVEPQRVAIDIMRGIDKRKKVVYTPGYWKWIMTVLRMLPEAIFCRLPI